MKDKLKKDFTFPNHHKPFVVSEILKVKEALGEKEKKNNIDEKKLFDTSSKSAKPKSQGKKKP